MNCAGVPFFFGLRLEVGHVPTSGFYQEFDQGFKIFKITYMSHGQNSLNGKYIYVRATRLCTAQMDPRLPGSQ